MKEESNKPANFEDLLGRINAYDCSSCHKTMVTIDHAKGTTPFMIGCRETPGCKGSANSRFYTTKEEEGLVPKYEWFKPSPEAIASSVPEWKRHFEAGGLDLRLIPPECNYCGMEGEKLYDSQAGSIVGIGKGGKKFDNPVYVKACKRCFVNRGGVIVEAVGNKTSRNEPCPCGSGKKYKKCCGRG